MAFSPREPTPRPAVEAVMRMRDGEDEVAETWSKGAKLDEYVSCSTRNFVRLG